MSFFVNDRQSVISAIELRLRYINHPWCLTNNTHYKIIPVLYIITISLSHINLYYYINVLCIYFETFQNIVA